MKEFRLSGWPDLSPPYQRVGYRRILSDMSLRHVTVEQLADSSGMRRQEVREFIDMLDARGLIAERNRSSAPASLFGSLRPLGGWLRRALAATQHGR
jgi:hypothetical protein